MGTEDILKRLEEREKLFHTKPFLSTTGGGMNCYNVPVEKLPGLVFAFRVLFRVVPDVEVFSRTVVDIAERGISPLFNRAVTVPENTTLRKYVEIGREGDDKAILVTSSTGVWERVKLEVPREEIGY